MADRLLGYRETEALLEAYEIHLAPARLVNSVNEAAAAAEMLGFPVALKLLSPDQTHKTDAGLVVLNLAGLQAVRMAAQDLLGKAASLAVEGLLVQRMAAGGVETLIGIHLDPQFGPVVAFGAGGVLVELVEDVALRLPPLTLWEAGRMLAETRVWKLLQGYRGRPRADIPRLAELLVRVARLAGELGPRLVSLDLNPVFVLPEGQGVSLVDARAVIREEG